MRIDTGWLEGDRLRIFVWSSSRRLEYWGSSASPHHWVPILGERIKNVHLKEFTQKGTDHSLESFRPLLDGTTNWPAVTDAFAETGYEGYVTFEYFHPYPHYPEALIYQSSDSLDRILGRI